MPAASKLKSSKELPLLTETTTKIDPKTGSEYTSTILRRGVLGIEKMQYKEFNPRDFCQDTCTPRQDLEQFCDHLRDCLEKDGLPSDRTPHWINENGRWRPMQDADKRQLRSYKSWIKRVEDLTEDLSDGRIGGDLLLALVHLLSRKGIDDHLWDIMQVMNLYHRLRLSGRINRLATQGLAARRGRQAGPKSRRTISAERRATIQQIAREFRASNPIYAADAQNTAFRIADQVNKTLADRKLLGKNNRPLSAKTIADHIRASSCA